MELSRRASLWGMVAILLIASAVFITHIGQNGVWIDEWYSWHMSGGSLLDVPARAAEMDVHPPVYYQMLGLWRAATGSQAPGIMRLPSALFALLSVALINRVAAGWFGRRWVGLGAAATLAASGVFVFFARELRMYALTAFLVTLSWWFLLRLTQGRRRAWLGYGAVVGLMAYTYYFSAFVVLMQGLVILILFRQRLRTFLLALVIPLLAILPWLPSLALQMAHEREWSGVTDPALIGKFGATAATSLESLTIFANTYTNGQPGLVLLVIVLAIAGLWHPAVRRDSRWRRATVAALFWSLGTVSFFFGLNLFIPVYNPRYPLYALPGLAMLAGAALIWLPGKRWRAAGVAGILLIGLLTHPGGFFTLETPHAQILGLIEAAYRPGDRIVYAPGGQPSDPDGMSPLNFYLESGIIALPPAAFARSEQELGPDGEQARIWDVRAGEPPAPLVPVYLNGRWLTQAMSEDIYTIRLYEPLPAQGASLLDDTLQLRAVGPDTPLAAGDAAFVRTWWRALEPPPADFSTVIQLRNADGTIVAQSDAGLSADGLATSMWDSAWRFAPLAFTVPEELAPGDYSLWLGIYDWRDPVRLPVQSETLPVDNEQRLIQVGTVRVNEGS